jgi:hypothetical protein
MAFAKLKRYKSPGSEQIPAELIQARGETWSEIHKLINFISNNEYSLISGRSLLFYQFTRKVIKVMCSNYREISILSTSNRILSNILLARLSPYIDEIVGILNVGINVTDQLLIRCSAFIRCWRKN